MRHLLIALLAVVPLVVVAQPARAELVDAVAATVDREVVLYSELMAEIGPTLEELRRTATSREDYNKRADAELRKALNEAIDARLLVREARKFPELAVSDKDIDDRIEEIRTGANMTPERFIEVIGSMSEFREHEREQLLAMRVAYARASSFEKEVVISEDQIAAYFNEHKDKFVKPERVYVRQIFLRVQNDEERAQAHAKLDLLRDEINAGTSFSDLAKLHSQGPEASEGGAIGWQQQGDLVEPLNSTAFGLQAGQMSEIVDSQFGVHLLKVDERENGGDAGLSDVRIDIEPILRKQEAQKKFDVWLADLRKRSRVRIFI